MEQFSLCKINIQKLNMNIQNMLLEKCIAQSLGKVRKMTFHNVRKCFDRQVWANGVDPDLHCLPIHLHLLNQTNSGILC